MEPTQSSKTSAFNTQTSGKYPEDNLSLLQHGESLTTRRIVSVKHTFVYLLIIVELANSTIMKK
jgi:hypothetical protein